MTHSNSTLYLLQSCYAASAQHIQQLAAILQAEDHVVLMGDCVLQHQHALFSQHSNCYVLAQDLANLNHQAHHLQVLDYAEFADLCLSIQRCISFK
jgi:sulfur relay protein TusB/DsrH